MCPRASARTRDVRAAETVRFSNIFTYGCVERGPSNEARRKQQAIVIAIGVLVDMLLTAVDCCAASAPGDLPGSPCGQMRGGQRIGPCGGAPTVLSTVADSDLLVSLLASRDCLRLCPPEARIAIPKILPTLCEEYSSRGSRFPVTKVLHLEDAQAPLPP